jgi:hypothetical protein
MYPDSSYRHSIRQFLTFVVCSRNAYKYVHYLTLYPTCIISASQTCWVYCVYSLLTKLGVSFVENNYALIVSHFTTKMAECRDSVQDVADPHPGRTHSERPRWGAEVDRAGADCCYSGAGQFVPQTVACYDAGAGFPEFFGVGDCVV